MADPGGFPRFLETSQNLQHVGWVWSYFYGRGQLLWQMAFIRSSEPQVSVLNF